MSKKPGWYVDPEMPGSRRYWDGQTWSEHVAPANQLLTALQPWFRPVIAIALLVLAIAILAAVLG